LPTAIDNHALATLNGQLYVLGGSKDERNWVALSNPLMYELHTNSWVSVPAPMRTGFFASAAL
jgi:hypothetical protein